MAQRTHIEVLDDLDGSPADKTTEFGLDGVTFVIDLTEVHDTALREALAPYIAKARRQPRDGQRSSGTTARSGMTADERAENKAIRFWARQQGYEVAERGRIPAHVTEAYRRAGRAA